MRKDDTQIREAFHIKKKKKSMKRDFPHGPVVKTVLPMPDTQVPSLFREIDPAHGNKDPTYYN